MEVYRDKVIIVTGASEGIGRALCLEFARDGAKIVLAARNKKRLESLAGEIEKKGGQALVVPTDVTREKECKNLIDKTVRQWGRIDALVNNAGQTMWFKFEKAANLSVYEDLMNLNYLGSVRCTFFALPHIIKNRGQILGVSSGAGLIGIPTRTAYAGSKHAMFGFFNALRVELLESGVSVTMIAPDFVKSKIHERALDASGRMLKKSPLSETGIMTAEECARRIADAMKKRKRQLNLNFRITLGQWLSLITPRLLDRIALKTMRKVSAKAGVEL